MPRGVKAERKDPAARPAVERGIPMKVVDALLDVLAVDEELITRDARLVEDLGADSLDVVELQMALEEEFGIAPFSDEDAERWEHGTIADVLAALKAKGVKVG